MEFQARGREAHNGARLQEKAMNNETKAQMYEAQAKLLRKREEINRQNQPSLTKGKP